VRVLVLGEGVVGLALVQEVLLMVHLPLLQLPAEINIVYAINDFSAT